jgi:hypothetical protein
MILPNMADDLIAADSRDAFVHVLRGIHRLFEKEVSEIVCLSFLNDISSWSLRPGSRVP